jgi:hydroxyacid-oxoacid transhydrogenase
VIDTAKAANLSVHFLVSLDSLTKLLSLRFTVYNDAELMDFINAPIGKGLPITQALRPLIAIPTTAGTGSETTGTAILDITSRSFKTGIANRALKPVLGIVVCYTHHIIIIIDMPYSGHIQYGIVSRCCSHQCRS